MLRALRLFPLLLFVVLTLPLAAGCGDMINPQAQKEKGVYDAVKERYNTAPGIKAILGEPKYPGLKKRGSIKLEILDASNEEALKEAVGKITEWYAESNSKMAAGMEQLYVYAVDSSGQPVWVGIYEAGSLSGQDIRVEAPSEANLPKPSEKA
ncbi:MAG TPA: hypothetical protein VEI97_01210 [bacterium]|nr:hypothetical protein [bacterium]